MNASNTPGPTLFASVRSSRDFALAAFAAALLGAFALHAGAFLPRLSGPERAARSPAIEAAPARAAPAVVARRPPVAHGATAPAGAEPCGAPRG
jgi:hypothetical protein